MNKQAHYWAAQEDRWHQQYLAAQKTIDELESRIWALETTLREISKINNKRDRYSDEIDGIISKALEGVHV